MFFNKAKRNTKKSLNTCGNLIDKTENKENKLKKEYPFFFDLFSRLSFIKEKNLHTALDYMIYASFKARLCAIYEVNKDESLSDEERTFLIDKFDTIMFLSLGCYFDEYAPSFSYKTHIISSRFEIYEKVFQRFIDSPFVMTIMSRTLYWFISEGWMKETDGSRSNLPNTDFDLLEMLHLDRSIEKLYYPIHDDAESIILPYCERELRKLIDSFK